MKIQIKKTGRIIEYKNYYFADIYDIFLNGNLIGNMFNDKGVKLWYAIFFDSENEDKMKLPEGCFFGENVIYSHNIKQVNDVLAKMSVYNINIVNILPKL